MARATNIQDNIQKVTSKGQITLPAAWRKAVGAGHIVLSASGDTITIRPARLEGNTKEMTVFDAIRDNKGKGLKVDDLRKILAEVEEEDGGSR